MRPAIGGFRCGALAGRALARRVVARRVLAGGPRRVSPWRRPGGAAAGAIALVALIAAAQGPPIRWSEGPPLPFGRDHHVTFIAAGDSGAFLYVAGGTDYKSVFGEVLRARIAEDGRLGEWEQADTLPWKRAGMAVAVAPDHVVVLGGQRMPDLVKMRETAVAAMRADGSLGPWVGAAPLPTPAFHHAALYHDGWVYVTGGLEERVSAPHVYGAPLSAEGVLGEWRTLTPMPQPRSHHALVAYAGHLYAIAGINGDPRDHVQLRDVIRAPILPDGTLGEWSVVGELPHAYGTHAALVREGHLYVLGGVEDNQHFVDTIWRAPLLQDGTVGEWTKIEGGLPIARGHVHQTPVRDGRIYTAGGRAGRDVKADVHIGEWLD